MAQKRIQCGNLACNNTRSANPYIGPPWRHVRRSGIVEQWCPRCYQQLVTLYFTNEHLKSRITPIDEGTGQ